MSPYSFCQWIVTLLSVNKVYINKSLRKTYPVLLLLYHGLYRWHYHSRHFSDGMNGKLRLAVACLVYSPEFFWTTSSIVCSLNGLSFIAHFLIFFKIRKFYKRTRPLDELETEDKKLHKNIRGAKVMLIITIAFTICWTPFMSFSFAFANGYSTDFNLQETSHWLVFLGMLNSVINPVIYAWYKQDFRKACQKTCSRDSIQRAVVRIRQSNT